MTVSNDNFACTRTTRMMTPFDPFLCMLLYLGRRELVPVLEHVTEPSMDLRSVLSKTDVKSTKYTYDYNTDRAKKLLRMLF